MRSCQQCHRGPAADSSALALSLVWAWPVPLLLLFLPRCLSLSCLSLPSGNDPLHRGLKLTERRPFQYYTQIIRIGLPLSLQDMLFSCCSMLIARFVAVYGDGAVAAQKSALRLNPCPGWLPTVLWPLSMPLSHRNVRCRTAGSCQSRLSFHHENCSCLGNSLHITACFPPGTDFQNFPER